MKKAGILMHISSLPSKYGIGALGEEAYKFVDFLKKSGQTYWQVLPVCPTNFGDSPYQSNSAFAGNPYFIDLDILKKDGLLKQNEIDNYYFGGDERAVDYKRLFDNRYPILRQAFSRFEKNDEYRQFEAENDFWLDDYAFFMSLKEHNHFRSWIYWDKDIRLLERTAELYYREKLSHIIDFYKFIQFIFFKQWYSLKKYANDNGIKIIGDMPIYVAFDSAEVWKNPLLFELDGGKMPVEVAGCPPDTFAEEGQLWGNPLYDWEYHKNTGYQWWINRVKQSLQIFDRVRVDHFRGFSAYYSIPFGREDAKVGRWRKGAGIELFDAIKKNIPNADIIAEDLGFLDNDVHELLKKTGYPGMRVLQFAFDGSNENIYLPHNVTENSVVYTGTHDNDTLLGWYRSLTGDELKSATEYFKANGEKEFCEKAILAVLETKAETAILPIQDYIGAGSEARMNKPATISGNWRYRITKEELTDELAVKIKDLMRETNRLKKI